MACTLKRLHFHFIESDNMICIYLFDFDFLDKLSAIRDSSANSSGNKNKVENLEISALDICEILSHFPSDFVES